MGKRNVAAGKGKVRKRESSIERTVGTKKQKSEGIQSIWRAEGGSLNLSRGQCHLKCSLWPVCELLVACDKKSH